VVNPAERTVSGAAPHVVACLLADYGRVVNNSIRFESLEEGVTRCQGKILPDAVSMGLKKLQFVHDLLRK
jgi:hypothetical protein